MASPSERLLISFVPTSDEDASQLIETLVADGGADEVRIESGSDFGFAAETVLAIVILGPVGLEVLRRLADWFRDRNDCLLVIDARGPDLRVEERCDIVGRRGQVIVVTAPDVQVVIKKNDAILDLQALVMHGLDRSASAIAEAARAAGASAEIEQPRSDL